MIVSRALTATAITAIIALGRVVLYLLAKRKIEPRCPPVCFTDRFRHLDLTLVWLEAVVEFARESSQRS